MKIGVISDIHAELDGLQAALSLLESHNVDQIVCCGDLVDRGADGDAVVARIKELEIPCVKGNHDRDAPVHQRWLRYNMDVEHPKVAKKLLTDESIAFLRALPLEMRFEWEGFRVLMVHGTLDRIDQYLYPQSPSAVFAGLARKAGADVVLGGHTHEPMAVKHRSTWFCNPGSIYRADSHGSYTCAVLTMPERHFAVYDIATGKQRPLG